MKTSDKLFEFIEGSLADDCNIEVLEAELDRRFGESCAIMVLDSSGFTRVTEALGPAYFLAIICRLRKICFEAANRFNATGSRAHADNFYAEFPSADDAVSAAFFIHRYFAENPILLTGDHDRFGVCVGIGFGRVLRSEREGVYGNEMNYASKLGEDVAEVGETILTAAAFDALSSPESFHSLPSTLVLSGVEMSIHYLRPVQQ